MSVEAGLRPPESDTATATAADTAPTAEVAAPPVYLVPVLTVRQELVLRALVLGWAASSLWFWLWWFAPVRGDWSAARAVATVGLAWLTVLGGYFLFFACRMTRPNPALPVPRLRVAIVVTKAPSEPWRVVERTLRAMLAQDLPYAYDVWLADERPSAKTLHWCRGHGVQVSSRKDVAAYHQPDWPRRTKSKEGNLAFFYDVFAYERYDVVAQLDADHVPEPGYLTAMVRPFADPGVGYVAAPSICDANERASWTVRGRLHRESSLHGPVGAGSNGGWGPLCIGSHYAVRTIALQEAGGLGPELAEDYSTSLWLQSAGWDGVFALDAEAHGDGPETLNDMLTQELQWSRSLGTILTKWAPAKLRTVPWRARTRMTFALLYYLAQGVLSVATTLLPSIGLFLGVTWGNATLADFYLRIWACSLFLLLSLSWLRHCEVLRPRRASLWSFELVLFQLVRWPWTTWGFFQGMWAGRKDVPTVFRVTPKGGTQARPLDTAMMIPPLALGLLPVLTIVLAGDPGSAIGLYALLVVQAVIYLSASLAVVVLHVQYNKVTLPAGGHRRRGRHGAAGRQTDWRLTRSSGAQAVAVTVALVLVGLAAVSWHVVTVGAPALSL